MGEKIDRQEEINRCVTKYWHYSVQQMTRAKQSNRSPHFSVCSARRALAVNYYYEHWNQTNPAVSSNWLMRQQCPGGSTDVSSYRSWAVSRFIKSTPSSYKWTSTNNLYMSKHINTKKRIVHIYNAMLECGLSLKDWWFAITPKCNFSMYF